MPGHESRRRLDGAQARWLLGCTVVWGAVLASAAPGQEAGPQGPQLNWQAGPAVGQLGALAEIKVPEGYVFLDGNDTRRFMEMNQNPINNTELGTLAPAEDDWFVVFEFDRSGYIKDDEGASLDADAILAAIKEGNKHGNEERRRRGWATMEIVGWEHPPRYNQQTKNLQWAVRATSQGHPVVNFNTRLLGREGVMKATLVANPNELAAILPAYQKLLDGYGYKPGHKYAEFRAGDKVAEYGLTALVAGGGLAVAAKSGLLGKLWKLILVGVLAVGGAIKALWAKVFGRRSAA